MSPTTSLKNLSPGRCPCGLGQLYESCCGPYHQGQLAAPTPLALMRSRYSAYALGLGDYLLKTWHPRTRPQALKFIDGKVWTGLEIVSTSIDPSDPHTGYVCFVASYQNRDLSKGKLQENSRFLQESGQWYYIDGTFDQPKLRF